MRKEQTAGMGAPAFTLGDRVQLINVAYLAQNLRRLQQSLNTASRLGIVSSFKQEFFDSKLLYRRR